MKAINEPEYANSILNELKTGALPEINIVPQTVCTPEQTTNNILNTSSGEESTDSWTVEGTLCFITEYEKLQESIEKGKMKQKDAFEQISKKLEDYNIQMKAKQCTTKLASLKRTYKKIKDHNAKSGNDGETWQYFERMDAIFAKKPWINPVAVCCSRLDTEDCTEQTSQEEETASQSKRKCRPSPTKDIGNKLLEALKVRREDRARQHNDKMERLDKLLAILENQKF